MSSASFLIGPIKDGIRRDVRPWAIPEDSWVDLINAYQWRGRVVRRSGYKLLGNLANGTPVMGLRTQEGFNIDVQNLIAFDTTQAYLYNGTTFVTLPSVMPVIWSGTDYQFFYSTNYAGAFWATNDNPGLNGYKVSLFAGAAGSTVNVTATGNNFLLNDLVYFLNVTGGGTDSNNLRQGKVTVAGNPFTVTATDGLGAFSNGVPTTGIVLSSTRQTTGQDGIRYYGVLTNGTGWANYTPPIDPNNALVGALLIFAYRGYLVFLNTWEGNEQGTFNYGNRARWTQIGTPYYSAPVPSTPSPQGIDFKAARDDLFGKGGANDAPTSEVIVGAAFIRDILVVYFERSTWRLRFVNNAQNPFVWERINVELGADCTFSVIPFDKGLMAIGNRGIVISDGNDTSRFDEKIPDKIFEIRQSNFGFQRVNGIRTFRTKLNYWTIPSNTNPNGTYPDQVLVFNYESRTWSVFTDTFTCFGYYYPSPGNITWNDLPDPWSSYSDISWDSATSQTGYENIVAGNQQGFVFILEENGGTNDPSLNISAITDSSITHVTAVFTSNNNNIPDGTWITLSSITGITSDDGVSLNGRNFKLSNPSIDPNNFTISEFKAINPPVNAVGTSYTYTIEYEYLFAGSIQINIGSLVFTDPGVDGILVEASSLGTGTIDYSTGLINLSFSPAILSTPVYIRIVSLDPLQGLSAVSTLGTYMGSGQIAIISNYEINSKYFNFFADDKRSRLSKIDFYMNSTAKGQFTCNVLADSSNDPINQPLADNLLSNVVLTTTNPYQIGQGNSTIFRLFCDAIAQTVQIQLTMSDAQLATHCINSSSFDLQAIMMTIRRGGRLI